ncbi:MAG: argininosuccinate synthase, partial [Planctomycetes bacterium]|nr:argininosuccinate synthase [Planctomycetota bacterium]
VYDGQWFCPLREALDAFVAFTQRHVTGRVKVRLFKGRATAASIDSPQSLYDPALASFAMGEEYQPTDATGFIRLFGLQMKVNGMRQRRDR